MAIAHDLSLMGRLTALLEMCEMHAARGDMRHMPGLVALIDQTNRVRRETVRQEMESAKRLEPQIKAQPRTELPI